MVAQAILTYAQIQATTRTLSDATIHSLSHLANPSYFPIIRAAMLSYVATRRRDYTLSEQTDFYEDFMAECSITQTGVRTLIDHTDRNQYIDVYNECIADNTLSPDSAMLYVTQYLLSGDYTGSIITCQDGKLDSLIWLGIDRLWNMTIMRSVEEKNAWLKTIMPFAVRYDYYTFAALGQWPRVLVGAVEDA